MDVGLVALVERQEVANDLAYVAQPRVLFGRIHGDVDRAVQLLEHFDAGGFQAVDRVVGDIALHVMARGEIAQAGCNADQNQHEQKVAERVRLE